MNYLKEEKKGERENEDRVELGEYSQSWFLRSHSGVGFRDKGALHSSLVDLGSDSGCTQCSSRNQGKEQSGRSLPEWPR